MIRKLILPVCIAILLSGNTFAQNAGSLKKIAPFKITLNTGSAFSADKLAQGPVILIYFSPDCEHCQDFTKDMLKNYSVVGKKQVVMVTPQSMEMIRPFVSKFNLSAYPNIKIGTEGSTRLVQKYYNVMQYPFIALYDKTGKLVKSFEGEQPHIDIFNAMKTL
ncbi:redoxin domain-containing protein [Dyadobacter sp. 32]|uniref:TlpA family protein disulfide reductase n=1 Tax=Dyadobacter sp. 32 TaxID=538966 RepID=UPI0011ED0853